MQIALDSRTRTALETRWEIQDDERWELLETLADELERLDDDLEF